MKRHLLAMDGHFCVREFILHAVQVTVVLCLFCFAHTALGQGTVDLRTWSQEGASSAGNWTVASDGSDVFQSINGAPTFFVSPNEFLGTTVVGRFGVETTGDNDFIGFVFGYQAPLSSNNDPPNSAEYILFDWKQGSQSGAPEGFWLGKVSGTHNGTPGTSNQLWPKTSDSNITLTQFGAPLVNDGWSDNTQYDFELVYQPDKIEIYIQGGTGTFATRQQIYDVPISSLAGGLFPGDMFPSGRFGFYNFSQENVRYQGFTQADDPILVTNPSDGGTLQLGQTRAGTSSAPGNLTITNGATVGSLLTGNVSAASGELSGPAPDPGFSLMEQQSTIKTFTHSPLDRGLDSQVIDITSDGGAASITLEGTGVGPVFDSSIAAGTNIDFGDVNQNAMAMLPLVVSNVTPDVAASMLTDLTLEFDITGTDASQFDLNLVPGTVVSKDGMLSLDVSFTADAVNGNREATLTLSTDENAALGDTMNGTSFTWTLSANVVPEPAAWSLLLSAFAVGLARRRD